MIFDDKVKILLSSIYDHISNDKFIFDIINKIAHQLLFKDYITFYLNKSEIYSKSQINNK